jgi:hypothetical protein
VLLGLKKPDEMTGHNLVRSTSRGVEINEATGGDSAERNGRSCFAQLCGMVKK